MNIIVPKRTIVFSNHGQVPAGIDGDGKTIFKNTTRQQRTVTPGPGMQVVPDWIRDTDGWKACVKDGSAVEIGVPAAPVAVISEKRPPTLEEVLAAGYKGAAAASIVAEEVRKYEAGEFPYPPKDGAVAPKKRRGRRAATAAPGADASDASEDGDEDDAVTAMAENAGGRDDSRAVILPPGFKSPGPPLQVEA